MLLTFAIQPLAIVAKPMPPRAVSAFVLRNVPSGRTCAVVVVDFLPRGFLGFVDRVERGSATDGALLWLAWGSQPWPPT
jgi:hypothetical protein